MTDPALDVTRRSLHAVAELVLAGPQHRHNGEIALIVEPDGFRTRTSPVLRVAGLDLVAGGQRVPMPGNTCAGLAAAAGVDVGAPRDLYHDGSGAGPDDILQLDAEAARWFEDCWAAGDKALRQLADDAEPILWPEHFDVGVLLDGIGYGVSPGDTYLPEPYAYVNPGEHSADPFWNAPFGAARPMRDLDNGDVRAVIAFFTDARSRASAAANPQ
jgi:hypothetical protein